MLAKCENILRYKNRNKQLPVPFVIYADFEAINERIHSCKPNSNLSYTEAYQEHTGCGYSYKVVCFYDDKYSKLVEVYRGKDAVYRCYRRTTVIIQSLIGLTLRGHYMKY